MKSSSNNEKAKANTASYSITVYSNFTKTTIIIKLINQFVLFSTKHIELIIINNIYVVSLLLQLGCRRQLVACIHLMLCLYVRANVVCCRLTKKKEAKSKTAYINSCCTNTIFCFLNFFFIFSVVSKPFCPFCLRFFLEFVSICTQN